MTQAVATTVPAPTGQTVVVVGHARLPQSLAPRDASSVVSLELEVDLSDGGIVGIAAKAVPELGSKLLSSVLLGRNIGDGPWQAIEEVRHRYICPSQKAVCTAIANAFEAYERYRQAA